MNGAGPGEANMPSEGFRRVLLAVDGSEQSMFAAAYLAGMLSAERTSITLFQVIDEIPELLRDLQADPEAAARLGLTPEAVEDAARLAGEKAREILLNAGFGPDRVTVKIKRHCAGVAKEIVAESLKGYDLVSLGRTGASEVKNILIGSVANKILCRLSAAPLCVIAGRPEPGRVLLALDLSEGSKKAVRMVADLVRGPKREVILFHAVRRIGLLADRPDVPEIGELEQQLYAEDEARMVPVFEQARRTLAQAGYDPALVTEQTETDVPSRAWAIVRRAQKSECGAIVVGRRGMSRFDEFLMGRVGNKVVMLAENQAVFVAA